MKKFWPTILLVVSLCASASAADAKLRLVSDNSTAYSICISEQASPSEQRGAEELQKFLFEISGARLPIITDAAKARGSLVLVGKSRILDELNLSIPFEGLGPEGFVLKTVGPHMIIAGGRQRGTMYGVYTFLEKLGCRWFTRDVSHVPRMRSIVLDPLEETHRPAFEYREPFFTEALDKDWAARNKVNGAHSQLDESTGGKIEYYPFVHSFYRLIPPEKYFRDHSEYFSLIDGKRRAERGQLCLSNAGALRLAVETVLKWIAEHPEATIFSVSQNDWDGWCECDSCSRIEQEEGGVAGPLLRFVNAIAAEVDKKYPGKLIDTLAYQASENPPLKTRPRSNVRVRLCPIGACEAHPYEKCDRNAYFMQNLRGWSKISNQLYVWHYTTNFSHYLLPFPDFDELAADIPMYRRHGVVGLFLQGAVTAGGGGENAELRSYVEARLLWDPGTDVNRTVDEFLAACYGKAAKPMRAYFDLLHQQVRLPPNGKGQHIWIRRSPDLSEEVLQQAQRLFIQAEALSEDEAVRRRVRKARLSIDYAELIRSVAFTVKDGWYAPVEPSGLTLRFRKFMSAARRFGITNLREGSELNEDEQQFVTSVKAYRIATLENAAMRVDVVPELSGRIIRIIDRSTGRDLLRHANSADRWDPNVGGLGLFVYPDFHARQPLAVKWQLMSRSGKRELVLTGTCANGLKLRRRIQLKADSAVIHTETIAENAGTSTLDAALQSILEPNPGAADLLDFDIAFRKQDGSHELKTVFSPGQLYKGAATYQDTDLPDGEWRLVNRGLGFTLINRFQKDQADRGSISWRARGENRVIIGLWSKKRTLTPGESLELEADYEIKRNRRDRI